jgi:hypothetical protein
LSFQSEKQDQLSIATRRIVREAASFQCLSVRVPCERCGTVVAMLIFAPNATDPGHFEDYARKMYPHYNHLNVPTWILGPALGEGPPIERPADVLKVCSAREPIQRLPPAQFNSLLDLFVTRHCH